MTNRTKSNSLNILTGCFITIIFKCGRHIANLPSSNFFGVFIELLTKINGTELVECSVSGSPLDLSSLQYYHISGMIAGLYVVLLILHQISSAVSTTVTAFARRQNRRCDPPYPYWQN